MHSTPRKSDFRALLSDEPPESQLEPSQQSAADEISIGPVPAPPAGAAFVVDHELRYLVAEGDALRLAGFCPEDFIGKTIFEALEPELARSYEPDFRNVLAGGSFAREHESHGRNFLSRGAPLREPGGRIHAALVLSYDVTDRKRAELLERRGEEILSGLIENAPFGVVILDAALRLRACNAAAELALGHEALVLGRDFAEVLHGIWPEPFISEALDQFAQTLVSGEPHVAQTVLGPSGSTGSYDWRIQRLTLPEGTFGLVCYLYDLTAIRRAEVVLTSAARRHAFLVEFTDAIATATDAQNVTTLASDLLRKYLGIEQVTYLTISAGDDDAGLEAGWRDASGQTAGVGDLETFATSTSAASLSIPVIKNQRLVGVLLVRHSEPRRWTKEDVELAKDVAERIWSAIEGTLAQAARQESEARLRELNHRKDEFFAVLAHELRNPLAPIRAGLELLRLAGDTAHSVGQLRGVMERQLAQLVRLVDDLLDVSRIDWGKVQLQRGITTLAELVDSAVEAHQTALDSGGRELVLDLPQSTVRLEVDSARVIQVLSNLLHNAIKFTKPGDLICIAGVVEAPASLLLTVTDTGAGISREALPKIFDLFIQGSADAPQGGLGIGLSLAKRLVELHGGTLAAASGGHGLGSVFTIRLPVLSAPAEGAATSSPARPAPLVQAAVPLQILVVDDNADGGDMLALLLGVMGGQVRVAYSGESALQQLTDFRPQLVFVDIIMPGMDGYETCRRLRAALGVKVQIVALTGLGQERDKELASQAGFDAHLTKPVDPEFLKRFLTKSREPL